MHQANHPDDRLTERAAVRFTRNEYRQLCEQAALHGITVSKFIRARMTGARIASRADLVAIAELRRQGGLLKHLVQTANTLNHRDVQTALTAITEAIGKLSR